jgi:hypothetical protein
MDHRCLYGHRVPAAFTFAIQNRNCPTCGANTVTVEGYQLARKLATEVGLEAVQAFNAVRVVEADYVLTRLVPAEAPAAEPAAQAAPAAPPPALEEEVVVEDGAEAAAVVPEPKVAARKGRARTEEKPAFDQGEEDFFKSADS